ncbi:MAG: M2 family metallopeptidase [bacterium]|nr:M2 family metallopeptidase [bacterium]
MFKFRYLAATAILGVALWGAGAARAVIPEQTPQQQFSALRDQYVAQIAPLEKDAKEAWWISATVGSDESYARREQADKAMARLHQDKSVFQTLKKLRESGAITDPVEARQLDLMYFAYLPYQADSSITAEIISKEAEVDKIFNTHRSQVNGKSLTENDVRKVIAESSNGDEAKQAWLGYMEVGRKVAPPLKELIKLRNKMARQLGYRDYFAMQLDIQEFQEGELFQIFDELDKLTIKPFTELKNEIDTYQRKRFDLKDNEPIRPWHLGDLFFQEAPELKEPGINLDDIYKGKDPVKLASEYYESLNMNPQAIIDRSDLYERPGKSPHAFEECMDRQQDIRVLCNVKPNGAWMDTMLHELGHGVYDQGIDPNLPFLLRTPAHILTTEGFAMLMGEMTRTTDFLNKVAGVKGEKLNKYGKASWRLLRSERLIFSRWTQTVLHFEKEMYANPDQDLNKLWWDLKKKYQLQAPPLDMSGQDYGAKMHIVGAPVYYHNYMLGDLFGTQVYEYVTTQVLGLDNPLETSMYGQLKAGQYIQNEIFRRGNRYSWQDLCKLATGEPLSPKAFARLYLK